MNWPKMASGGKIVPRDRGEEVPVLLSEGHHSADDGETWHTVSDGAVDGCRACSILMEGR